MVIAKSNRKIFVRDRVFYQTLLTIALPVILQSLITTGVNFMDTMMIAACGELELSACSLANQFINLFHILCNGMGFGAAVLTAQFWGSQNLSGVRQVTTIMLRICLVISSLFTAASFFVPNVIMGVYTPDGDIIYQGTLYLRLSAATFLLYGVSQTLSAVMRSVRQVKLPLIMAIISFFVNIFFNWVFIFGHFGAPEMRIEGAALGTLIARIVEFLVIAVYFLFIDKRIGYRLRHLFENCSSYIRQYITYSIPVLVSDALLGLGNNMVSVIMGHIGASFVAAFAIVSQVTRMLTIFTQGVSNASSIITGNTIGEGRYEDAYNQGRTFLALAICVGLFASLATGIICPLIVSSCDLSPETVAIAYQLVAAVCVMTVFNAMQSVLTKGVLRGAGDTRFLMVADILFLWLASVPLGYFAGIVWHLPAFFVYIALQIDHIIKAIWCTIRLNKGKWVKRAKT